MGADLMALLDEARKLPPEQRRQLASKILEEIPSHEESSDERVQAARAIVEQKFGSIKGWDRATLIRFAEDEGFSGY